MILDEAEVLPPGKATSIGVSSGDNRAPGDNQPIALASLPRSEHDFAPIAKHRRRDAQFPCDLRQRPTAARQQGYCLPLELIGKLTTSLAHSTPSRSSSELSKGVHQFAGGVNRR